MQASFILQRCMTVYGGTFLTPPFNLYIKYLDLIFNMTYVYPFLPFIEHSFHGKV